MLFGKNNKYQKNLDRFNFYVKEIVSKANDISYTPDCYDYLKPALDRTIEKSKNQIESWDASTDVQTLAYKVLFNISFDLLSSGNLHIYRGQLDPMKPCDKLQFIVNECIKYFVNNGFITQAQAKEQVEMLHENIADVG